MPLSSDFPMLKIVDHPLVQHKLTLMRDETRTTQGFRRLLREISLLMGYELTRDLPLTTTAIRTPLSMMEAPILDGKKLVVVPILRAGLGMVDALVELVPSARIGHIGLRRDETTHRPEEYLVKLPEPSDRLFIILDPMLATGHSAVHAVNVLIRHGVRPDRIRLMALVSAPEGVKTLSDAHPQVRIYTAALDSHLNEHAYIVPGLGDAGDRLFGTW